MTRSLVDCERYGSMGKRTSERMRLPAEIMGILQSRRFELPKVGGLHVGLSNPSCQGLVRARSCQPELNQFTGMVWVRRWERYWCGYEPLKANLAETPNRRNLHVRKQLGTRTHSADSSVYGVAVESRMATMAVLL